MPEEISVIAQNAFRKIHFEVESEAIEIIKKYAMNGRDAVNIAQIAAGIAVNERGSLVKTEDVEWVINFGQYSPRPDKKIPVIPQIGVANGLAVYGTNLGTMMEIEVCAMPNKTHTCLLYTSRCV